VVTLRRLSVSAKTFIFFTWIVIQENTFILM
jgi:hypothetical protein